MENHVANPNRYTTMPYRRTGRSGLMLPAISLGLWHNFGSVDDFHTARRTLLHAFDCGITHFDLANNYGPLPGSAESTFGRVMREDLHAYRDEIVVSTKAGYDMWSGPYGSWGSRKHLLASLDQSLHRMGLDYVDIFYSHRPDPQTPIEETMGALDRAVRSGRALYAGISNYNAEQTEAALAELKRLGTPCLINQSRYSMFDRHIEPELLDVLERNGVGLIAFSPLAQGLLTDKYLNGIPDGSRAAQARFLKPETITAEYLAAAEALNRMARERGETLAQMAVAWLLKDTRLTSVLVGAHSPEQLDENIGAIRSVPFDEAELKEIDAILSKVSLYKKI